MIADVWRQWVNLVLEVYSMMMIRYQNSYVCKMRIERKSIIILLQLHNEMSASPYIPAKFIFNGDGKAWQHITLMSIFPFALDLWRNIVAVGLRRIGRANIQCVGFASLCHHFQFAVVGATFDWRIQFSAIF